MGFFWEKEAMITSKNSLYGFRYCIFHTSTSLSLYVMYIFQTLTLAKHVLMFLSTPLFFPQ